jgi:NTP pyrophosphatase (non-canonical NTP hydrolase)
VYNNRVGFDDEVKMNKFVRNRLMNESHREIMLIAQEECAEVIQAISKVFRFGMESEHNGVTNREHLQVEIGDVLCMIDLMNEQGLIDWSCVEVARTQKREKLQKWSKIKLS